MDEKAKGVRVDLESLMAACAAVVSSGGIKALGELLGTATVSLIKKLRKPGDDATRTDDGLLVMAEISQPEKLALDLTAAAEEDPSIAADLEEWKHLAEQQLRPPSVATAISGNAVSGVNGSGRVTIIQRMIR